MEYSTVVSLVPLDIFEEKHGVYPGLFKIPKSNGKTPQLLKVGESIYYMYVGEGRGEYGEVQGIPSRSYIKREVTSIKMAESIVADYLDGQLSRIVNEAEPAIFYVPGDLSLVAIMKDHKDKIDFCLQKQHNWFVSLVKDADDGWEKHRQHKLINDTQRMAATSLGLDRPWLLDLTKGLSTIRCGVCRTEIMSDAIVCPQCKAVLDPEKFKTVQFAKVG